jgi:xylitol oxidase
MPSVKNYGRTWTFRPSTIAYPENAAQLQAVVAGARRVRVMGSRHSWSKGIVTDGTLVSLDRMNRLVRVDRENLRVTVEAGIKLGDLIGRLEEHGLALANLGSIDEQSLAGAISPSTARPSGPSTTRTPGTFSRSTGSCSRAAVTRTTSSRRSGSHAATTSG